MPNKHPYRYVCVPCRIVDLPCSCTEPRTVVSGLWSPPKRNDNRAWKRIESGEWNWDRRRVLRVKTKTRRNHPTTVRYESELQWVELPSGQMVRKRVVTNMREIENYNELPNIDLGA